MGLEDLLQSVPISKSDPSDVFESIETIGKGNYGVVVKARNKETGDIVAIKQTMLNEMLDVESAIREIRVLQSCNHRNVVRYYGTYRTTSALWVVMEYCDGGSIDLVRKVLKHNLPESLIAYILHETLLGLQYMHSNHKIHRDIKGGNILFTSKGDVKLADFGVTAELNHTLSRRNSSWGTFLYMAPEVLVESDYDEKADMWSLGICTLEMAEGVLPFSRMKHYPLIELLTKKPPPTLQHKDRFSPQMNVFIRRLLTQDKHSRPSAATMLSDSFLLHRDYSALREELADLVKQLIVRRRELGGGSQSEDWSSSDEDATFVQRRGDKGEEDDNDLKRIEEDKDHENAVVDGISANHQGSQIEIEKENFIQQLLLPLPLLCTEDWSFDALQYATEDPDPMQPVELLSLLTGRPPLPFPKEAECGNEARGGRARPTQEREDKTVPAREQKIQGRPHSTVIGFEDNPPCIIWHTTKMLQYLHLYYKQLPSMRCLTKQEANSMTETRSKIESTLGCIYHLWPLKES